MVSPHFDISLKLGSDKRRFRLLQQEGRKLWKVHEVPPQPQLALGGAAKEGLPAARMLPFTANDWSWGTGLLQSTSQTAQAGHTLRYADGQSVDTSEVGIVRHGPLIASLGTTSANILFVAVLGTTVFLISNQHVYSWDGTTLTSEYTHGSADFTDAVVHGAQLFVASGADYLYGTEAEWKAGNPTTEVVAADRFLTLGPQLWRAFDTNLVSASTDPGDGSPVWASGITVGAGEAITNLYTISGLLGVATQETLYLIDSETNNIELDNKLRTRRSADAFSIVTPGGSDVWFSDELNILRLVANGFEVFDLRPEGPFHSTDELPVTFPDPLTSTIKGIAQDLEAAYVIAERGGNKTAYKGVEVARGVFAWSPIMHQTGTGVNFAGVAKLASETTPFLYWNDDTELYRIPLVSWSAYSAAWEFITPYFDAGLPSWEKLFHTLRVYLETNGDGNVTPYYRVDETSGWTQFGSTAMSTGGNNEIVLTAPIAAKRIQLRFVGAQTTGYVHMRSFLAEGLLRPPADYMLDFTIVSDNKSDNTFLKSLRTASSAFITIEDRFGDERTCAVLPGFPVELEVIDEIEKQPVRAYQFVCQEIG